MSDPSHAAEKAPVRPGVCYDDPFAAYDWLQAAFGFEPLMMITDPYGGLIHAEVAYRESAIGVSKRWSADQATPGDVGGRNTQSIHVQLREDIDLHFERAKAAGAHVLLPPQDQPYGDRDYIVKDLEGHVWSFGQTIYRMTGDEYAAKTGAKVEGPASQERPS